jgi:hypothetical protein
MQPIDVQLKSLTDTTLKALSENSCNITIVGLFDNKELFQEVCTLLNEGKILLPNYKDHK